MRLEDVGRFVAWLRLAPESRSATKVVALSEYDADGLLGDDGEPEAV
ncbi:hypothetical protein NWT09_12625 [Mycolicibacterium sp. jd]